MRRNAVCEHFGVKFGGLLVAAVGFSAELAESLPLRSSLRAARGCNLVYIINEVFPFPLPVPLRESLIKQIERFLVMLDNAAYKIHIGT